MSRLATILVAVLLAAGCTSTDDLDATPTRTPVPRWQTLDNVIDRDELRCGVDHELAPFGYAEADGTVSGFEIEFCAAIAAAVLRDASKVVYVLAEDRARHFDLLRDGSIDVLMPTTAVTATHDREWGADFAQPVFYTGQAFVVHVDSPFYSLSDLDEALICFHPTAANTDPFPWEGMATYTTRLAAYAPTPSRVSSPEGAMRSQQKLGTPPRYSRAGTTRTSTDFSQVSSPPIRSHPPSATTTASGRT